MGRINFLVLILVAALFSSGLAHSASVEDMYTAVIPVQAQTPDEFAKGARVGLEQVLVRLTGRMDISRESAIQSALRVADMYLAQFRYEGQTDQGVLLNLSFDSLQIEKLLREAKIAMWSTDRVPVVVWMVLESAPGEIVLVNSDSHPELTDALDAAALRRGLVLRYPLLDLGDMRVDPSVVWSDRAVKPLVDASERYESSTVLIGRFSQGEGTFEGSWQIANEDTEKSLNVGPATWDKQVELGVNLATDVMVSRYAISPVETVGDGVVLHVQGVKSFAAYSALVDSVRSLSAVRQVVPSMLKGDQVVLMIKAEGQLTQLQESLSRLPNLEAMKVVADQMAQAPGAAQPVEPIADATNTLHYRWR